MTVFSSGGLNLGSTDQVLGALLLAHDSSSNQMAQVMSSSGDLSYLASSSQGPLMRLSPDSTSVAFQDVSFATVDIDGGTIDGTVIGGSVAAAVSATTLSATGVSTLAIARTDSNTQSADTGVPTTLVVTMPEGLCFVNAYIAGEGTIISALVHRTAGFIQDISTLLSNGSITLSLSGASLQVTQTTGSTKTVTWSFIRIYNS